MYILKSASDADNLKDNVESIIENTGGDVVVNLQSPDDLPAGCEERIDSQCYCCITEKPMQATE